MVSFGEELYEEECSGQQEFEKRLVDNDWHGKIFDAFVKLGGISAALKAVAQSLNEWENKQ